MTKFVSPVSFIPNFSWNLPDYVDFRNILSLTLSSISHWHNIQLLIGSKPNLKIFSCWRQQRVSTSPRCVRQTSVLSFDCTAQLHWKCRRITWRFADILFRNVIKLITERSVAHGMVVLLFCWISPLDSRNTPTGCNLKSHKIAKHLLFITL